jgi:hypothetical protein
LDHLDHLDHLPPTRADADAEEDGVGDVGPEALIVDDLPRIW